MKSLEELSRRGVSLGPRGNDFVRAAIALAINQGADHGAIDIAARRWGSTARAVAVTKAAVESMTTGSFGADFESAASEFFAAATAGSIVGRLAGLRRVPLRVRTLTASGAVAHWVGEGQAKPISTVAFTRSSLAALKVLAISVATKETFESTDSNAETAIRQDLLRVTVEALDGAFIDPDNAGVAGIMPASVTNGLSPVSWVSADATGSLATLVDAFAGDLAGAYLVTGPATAVLLASADHPRIGARGGDLAGIPVLTSRSVPAGTVALVDPAGVAYGEAGGELRTITQGDVLLDDAPDMGMAGSGGSPLGTPMPAQLTSLWQANCVALVTGRSVNWQIIRSGAVAYAAGAGGGSP